MFICKKEFILFKKNFYLLILFLSLVDNLPCATKYQNVETHEILYEHGYRLGMFTKQTGDMYLNNHLIMKLHYHKEAEYKNEFDFFFFEKIFVVFSFCV